MAQFDYPSNFAFFQNLKDSGAAPIDTTVQFNYVGKQNGIGYVTASREMDLGFGKKRIIFTLMLRKQQEQWQIFREHAVVIGDA